MIFKTPTISDTKLHLPTYQSIINTCKDVSLNFSDNALRQTRNRYTFAKITEVVVIESGKFKYKATEVFYNDETNVWEEVVGGYLWDDDGEDTYYALIPMEGKHVFNADDIVNVVADPHNKSRWVINTFGNNDVLIRIDSVVDGAGGKYLGFVMGGIMSGASQYGQLTMPYNMTTATACVIYYLEENGLPTHRLKLGQYGTGRVTGAESTDLWIVCLTMANAKQYPQEILLVNRSEEPITSSWTRDALTVVPPPPPPTEEGEGDPYESDSESEVEEDSDIPPPPPPPPPTELGDCAITFTVVTRVVYNPGGHKTLYEFSRKLQVDASGRIFKVDPEVLTVVDVPVDCCS